MRFYFLFPLLIAFLSSAVTSKSNENIRGKEDENSWISDFTDKVLHKLKHHGKSIGKQCFAKKKKGIVPSAEHLDSPLKNFGYPYFNEKGKQVVLKAEVPLSHIFGFRQPVKIGSRDYVIAGYPDELLAFFACFENYKVIGSSLNEQGHWIPNTGSIQIQMQNLYTKGERLSSTLYEMLFKYTLDRIIKYLNPVAIIKGLDCQILGGCDAVESLSKFKKAMEKIKKWLPGTDKLVKKILEIYQEKKPIKDKIKEIIDFIKDEQRRKAGIRKQWIGWGNVSNKDKKILVTLTMYSKPEHGVRSTYYMGHGTVSMKDIGEAVNIALEKK